MAQKAKTQAPKNYWTQHFVGCREDDKYLIYRRIKTVDDDGFLLGREFSPDIIQLVLEAVEHAFQRGVHESCTIIREQTENTVNRYLNAHSEPIGVGVSKGRRRR